MWHDESKKNLKTLYIIVEVIAEGKGVPCAFN